MKKIDVSVIVPFYNEIDLVGDAIASILDQTISSEINIEILVINDGDFDNKIIFDNLPTYCDEEVKIITNDGAHGAGAARNRGIDMCSGTYIAFLDADDYWLADKLEIQMPLFDKGFTFVATGYSFDRANGSAVEPPRLIRNKLDLLKNTNVGTSTVIIERVFLGESRFSDREFSQDTELWANLANKPSFSYGAVVGVKTVYRASARTKSKVQQALHFFILCRDLDLGLIELIKVMVKYSFGGFRRHFLNFSKSD